MTAKSPLLIVVSAALLIGANAAKADSLLFKDGRFYEVPKIVVEKERLVVRFDHGNVSVPREMVSEFFALEDTGEYVPKNDEEKARVEKGQVPFEGRWISKRRRDDEIKKRNKKRQAALEDLREHQLWRNRYQKSTKHFAFEYTVPPEVAEEYQVMFEVYYDTFAKEWGARQSAKDGKLAVCFYNNESDFHRIGNVPEGVLGYFRFVEPIELNFFYERQDERLTLDVLFHETNHYLFHLLCAKNYVMPGWMNEGMAEYYGSSDWDPEKEKMSIGHLQEGRLVNLIDAMDGDEQQDLVELLTTPRIDAMQYAWSWSLCHMLMEDKKTQKSFKDYVKKIARDSRLPRTRYPANPGFMWPVPKEGVALFKKMLKINDLDAFEQEWYDYINAFEVKTARGYFRAGQFCVQRGRPVRACLYFAKAIELGADNPAIYESYGKVLIRRSKLDEAIGILEQGIARDPLNPYMHMTLGKAYLRKSSEEDRKKGKQIQRLALEMDPDDNRLIWEADMESRSLP